MEILVAIEPREFAILLRSSKAIALLVDQVCPDLLELSE